MKSRIKFEPKAPLIAAVAAVLIGGGVIYAVTRAGPPASEGEADHGAESHVGGGAGLGAKGHTAGGAQHEEGVVELTAAQLQASGITIVSVSRGGGAETRLAGRVTPMVDAKAAVGAPVGGTVERVLVAPGQSVRPGQPLAVIVSGDAAVLRADVDAAAASAQAARQAYERNRNLFEEGVVARQEVEGSRAQALSAEAGARAARARARASGDPSASGRLSIVSPIFGVVTSVQVGSGGFVAQGGVVAEVTNPARVELVFNASPIVAAQARLGSKIRVSTPSGETDAAVTGIAAGEAATVIRARLAGASLPAGSAVTGALVTGGDADSLSVPSEAVQTLEGRSVVFVQTDHGFRATPVMPGRQASGRTEILRGLTGAERIAGANAFLLKAELVKGEAGHEH